MVYAEGLSTRDDGKNTLIPHECTFSAIKNYKHAHTLFLILSVLQINNQQTLGDFHFKLYKKKETT